MRFAADRPLGLAPATALDYRELARRRLPRQLFDYIDGGAYEEATMRANLADLEAVMLRQVVMRDVSVRDPAVEVLGQRLELPIVLAPVGLAGMFARRAEVQAARAAETIGVPFVESTLSICSIEEVAEATTKPPWFQLYVMRDRGYVEELMARAQAVGSSILVLTVDLAVVGARQPRYAQCGRRPAERLGEVPPSAGSPQPPALDRDRGARRPATDLRQP